MAETVRQILEGINQRVETEMRFLWNSNARANLADVKHFKKLRNIEFFPNKVAMICAAGPSLSDPKHIEFIKKYREHLYIFAVDTAFPVLYKNDIYPDVTVNVDAGDLSSCFVFKKLPLHCKLVASSISHPKTIETWPNRKEIYLYNLKAETSETITNISRMFQNFDSIDSRLNVGEFIVQLAIKYFNFNLLIMTGLDFAYVGDKDYADGTAHEIVREEQEYTLLDVFEQPVKTSPSFIGFLIAFKHNFIEYYSKKALFFSLNKGILPFPYELDKAEKFMEQLVENRRRVEEFKNQEKR
ncbi:MAG: DUF115 domain-containing protein [Clostridia bacterium]|nr:DUF115 domain-containing protein [Clostridia bacterium]